MLSAWKARAGKNYYGLMEKYTSAMYLAAAPITELGINPDYPGYFLGTEPSGENDTKTVLQLPAGGRDLSEYHVFKENGVEYITNGNETLMGAEGVKELKASGEFTIEQNGYAVWLKPGSAAGQTVTIEVPEKGAFYVYNGDGLCLQNSRSSDRRTAVLTEEDTICLAGDAGQTFRLKLEPFNDALPGDWFYDAVSFVTEKKLAAGTGPNRFGPEETVNRAMAVTMLNKLSVQDAEKFGADVSTPAAFGDVKDGDWFAQAAAWAGGAGIAAGTGTDGDGSSSFGPEQSITREQLVQMLYRYAQRLGWETPAEGMAIREFSDGDQVSDWAQDAMRWAIGQGLISGKPAAKAEEAMRLDPQGTATRAEFAVILKKFVETAGK